MKYIMKVFSVVAFGVAALCLAATPASATTVVRTSAGVLVSGYTQTTTIFQIRSWPDDVTYQIQVKDSAGTLVCLSFSTNSATLCANWFPPYTPTGNGYEVTKP